MNIGDLVFVGFNRKAAALNRQTGEIVWQWTASSGSGFVTLHLDSTELFASVNGYTFCLDALTGREYWMNPMKGFGYGIPSICTVSGSANTAPQAATQAQQQQQQTSASSTSAT